jgi:hypothetical protein
MAAAAATVSQQGNHHQRLSLPSNQQPGKSIADCRTSVALSTNSKSSAGYARWGQPWHKLQAKEALHIAPVLLLFVLLVCSMC